MALSKSDIYKRYGFSEVKEWYYYDENEDEICFQIDEIKEDDLIYLKKMIENEDEEFIISSNEYICAYVTFNKKKKFDTKALNDKYGFIDINIEFESNIEEHYYFGTINDIYNREDSVRDILRHMVKCVNSHMINIILGFLRQDFNSGELE